MTCFQSIPDLAAALYYCVRTDDRSLTNPQRAVMGSEDAVWLDYHGGVQMNLSCALNEDAVVSHDKATFTWAA